MVACDLSAAPGRYNNDIFWVIKLHLCNHKRCILSAEHINNPIPAWQA
jgi:hypothetical protein